jgi:UDP-glucose 4-epimerase
VFGGGAQTRSFCDVRDTVVALDALATRAGRDTVTANVGNDREISIADLAQLVITRAGSASQLKHVPLREAYGEDFEDIRRRRPSLDRLRQMTGFCHRYTLEQTIDDLVAAERERLQGEKDGHCTLVRSQSERAA